ncbi:Alcohol oxidase [Paramyrothecium foliicola]|nr:Alcohol oxidase [Paramyrothecium foliicola]
MPLYQELPTEVDSVDVIIAGGGTAACVVASRLSDFDPNLSILVIEAGSNNYKDPTVEIPFLFFGHLAPGSKTMSFHMGPKSPYLGVRSAVVPTARILGGGSSVNMLMYSRGQRSDYDSWATPGWSTDDLLPFMKKIETYHGDNSRGLHGTEGPIHISQGTYAVTRALDTFVEAAEKVGFPEAADISDLESANNVQRAKRYISPAGKRQDAGHNYLHPRLQDGNHPNLHVLVDRKVVRVTFDGKRASGVTYAVGDSTRTVTARKQVVVSCGACGTPPVLERSGIGSKSILQAANVPIVVELPGVGDGYEDHHVVTPVYRSDLASDETLDGIFRPNDKDIADLGPKFKEIWDRDFKEQTDRPLTLISMPLGAAEATGEEGQYFSFSSMSSYPYSRGHMHITGAGVDDPLDFDPGLLSDSDGFDLLVCRWAYKKQREIARRMNIFRGEIARTHPAFPADSKARVFPYDASIPRSSITDIEYTADDDAAIDQYIKERISTPWHSLGTCKMGPREKKGVVDESLNVYGVTGLKIADLSICPKNVAAHTNATAFLVGEKAADILIKELSLGA